MVAKIGCPGGGIRGGSSSDSEDEDDDEDEHEPAVLRITVRPMIGFSFAPIALAGAGIGSLLAVGWTREFDRDGEADAAEGDDVGGAGAIFRAPWRALFAFLWASPCAWSDGFRFRAKAATNSAAVIFEDCFFFLLGSALSRPRPDDWPAGRGASVGTFLAEAVEGTFSNTRSASTLVVGASWLAITAGLSLPLELDLAFVA